jgi:two-component system NtrC family response regulator
VQIEENTEEHKMNVMIVDDEPSILFTLKSILKNHNVSAFSDANAAIESIRDGNQYEILVIDFRLQALSGLDILIEAKKKLQSYRAILLTAFSNKDLLEQVINNKLVFKVVNKPFEPDIFLNVINEAADNLKSETESKRYVDDLKNKVDAFVLSSSVKSCDQIMIHKSQLMRDILVNAIKYAGSGANLIITGENGVGKEVVGNIVHKNSKRTDKPFVKINCSAIPESLFESELFGYEKGAYTGAISSKAGKFKLADGGSIFLDEIGEIPLKLQAKLLRVIETKEISPLGSTETIKSDVRIICATNIDLNEKVAKGEFREDLFYRLNILNIHVPPLRERKEDIPILAAYFIQTIAMDEGGPTREFNREALEYLSNLEFRGNVRELKNIIHRIYLSSEEPEILLAEVKNATSYHVNSPDNLFEETMEFSSFKESMEKQYLEKQLAKFENNVTKTAEQLGLQTSNLYRKMKELGILVRK